MLRFALLLAVSFASFGCPANDPMNMNPDQGQVPEMDMAQAACTPNCAGKACAAADGCGGQCESGTCQEGSCLTGKMCEEGKCVVICPMVGATCTNTFDNNTGIWTDTCRPMGCEGYNVMCQNGMCAKRIAEGEPCTASNSGFSFCD